MSGRCGRYPPRSCTTSTSATTVRVLFDLPEDPSTAVDRHYAEALRDGSNGLLVPVVGFDDLRPAPAPTLIGSQPQRLDAAAYLFARYFKEEMHFDHVQYAPPESAEKNRKFETWLLNGRAEGRPLVTGAACFWPPGDGAPAVLRWVWVHPAFRRKGLLRTAWPTFTERYGRFWLEQPRTRSFSQTRPIRSEAAAPSWHHISAQFARRPDGHAGHKLGSAR